MNKKEYNIQELNRILPDDAIIKSKLTENVFFDNISPVLEANEKSLVWIHPSQKDKQDLIENTCAKVIICDDSLDISNLTSSKCFIVVENPRLVFIEIVKEFFVPKQTYGIHPCATIHPEAKIHDQVSIGANTYIGKCTIKKGTVIFGNCHIHDKTEIGKNVTIYAGAVIGSDGFGYARKHNGTLEKFPHFGGVVIKDNVEIGANTCIDRGTLGNTIIEDGVKIDNLVHIAHNVEVGANSVIIASSVIGGSTKIGENAWLALSVTVRHSIKIGKNSILGMGAVLTKDLPDNETWMGHPARPISSFLKNKHGKNSHTRLNTIKWNKGR